jgi:hypothetical protein
MDNNKKIQPYTLTQPKPKIVRFDQTFDPEAQGIYTSDSSMTFGDVRSSGRGSSRRNSGKISS